MIRAKDVFIGEAIGAALALLAGGALAISQDGSTSGIPQAVSRPSISLPSASETVAPSPGAEGHGREFAKDINKQGDKSGPGNSSFGHSHHGPKEHSDSGHG